MDLYQWLNICVSLLLPLLVGVLTKATWNRNLKAVLLLLVAAISAGLTDLITAGTLENWKTVLGQTAINWLIAVATHYHVWKPTGVAAEVASIGVKDVPPEAEHRAAA
jgi:hypothetical protein